MTFIIQYADLEDMIKELNPLEKVRITKIKSYEGATSQGLVFEVIGIHVRQIRDNRLFTWMYPVARYQTNQGVPINDEHEKLVREGWDRAEEVQNLIVDRLLNEDTFMIRPGIIDMGEITPLAGFWSLLDDEESQSE